MTEGSRKAASTSPPEVLEEDGPARELGPVRSKGCLWAAAAIVVIVSVLAAVIVPSLGNPSSTERSLPVGTIAFGTSTYPAACGVVDPPMAITPTSEFDAVGHLVRAVRVGENLTSALTFPDGHTTTTDQVMGTPASCIIQRARNLAAGHYAAEFRSGTEVLARGELTVSP